MNWIMTFGKSYLWWIIGIAFALLLTAYGVQTVRLANVKADYSKLESTHSKAISDQQIARADAESAARAKENGWTTYVAALTKVKNDEIKNDAVRFQSVIDGLRSRPDRPATGTGGMPKTAADGKIGTGAGLYREDGEFLAREAARANAIRSALAVCYKQYDAIN